MISSADGFPEGSGGSVQIADEVLEGSGAGC